MSQQKLHVHHISTFLIDTSVELCHMYYIAHLLVESRKWHGAQVRMGSPIHSESKVNLTAFTFLSLLCVMYSRLLCIDATCK